MALKIIGYLLLSVLAILIVAALYINLSGIPKYKVVMTEDLKTLSVQKDSATVVRGERIARMLCMKCHLGPNGQLTGKRLAEIPKAFGEIRSYNITKDPKAGIGKWTDGEIIYFLRTGIKPSGHYAPPYMPKFPHLADEDIHAIVAWLRSDKAEVQPSEVVQIKNKPSFLVKFLCRVVMKPMPLLSNQHVPDTNDHVALGKYLATGVLGCFHCHSESFTTIDDLTPENSKGYFGGGNQMTDLDGKPIKSLNLTPDNQSGIGLYTEEQFREILRNGNRPNGTVVRYPMEPYSLLTDNEIKAIYAYLRTVPPIRNDN